MKLLTVAALSVALLAGAGTAAASTEAGVVVRVVKAYQAAFLHRQPRAICSHLTGHAKRKLVGEFASLRTRPTCAAVMRSVLTLIGPEDLQTVRKSRRRIGADDVTLDHGQAVVRLSHRHRLQLVRIAHQWWVADTATS